MTPTIPVLDSDRPASSPDRDGAPPAAAPPPQPAPVRSVLTQALLRVDAARRLGPRAVVLATWHRSAPARAIASRALRDQPTPEGKWLPTTAPAPPETTAAHAHAILRRAGAIALPDWHTPHSPAAPAQTLDLFTPGDIRPVWERNRLAELPLIAQAARLDPAGHHLAQAEALLTDWSRRNPPYRGPNWACGQEAAVRALHLTLTLALLDTRPSAAMRDLLALHARRIAATPAYAMAQDNNHPITEAAGLFACGLALNDPALARTGITRLAAAVRRLVAPSGAFAVVSTGYHRLLLDTLAVAEFLRRRHAAPPLPDPIVARAAAAARWLSHLTDPTTGATPHLGHQDGSALADLSLAGPLDARASVERAARLFADRAGPAAHDPGCRWLGLPTPAETLPPPQRQWRVEGTMGWHQGTLRALLRTGPLRFRPGQDDLLHLDLWDGPTPLLTDAGTGAYNPPPGQAWWHTHFTSAAAHNRITFDDDTDSMPRVSRFLFARWPKTGLLPAGAWNRDHRGRAHARTVTLADGGHRCTIQDTLAGPFRAATLRWRLADAAHPPRISIAADAPCAIGIEAGWTSPAYGTVLPARILVARAAHPVSRFTTVIDLA